jgi:uncharacterized membrane protein
VRRWLPAAIAVLALAWLATLLAAPFLPTPLAGLLYAGGSLICHQLPDRSFHLHAYQLPVCARCFGLYAGGAAGSLAMAVFGRALRFPSTATGRARHGLTALAALPTMLTVIAERVFGWPLSNEIRAVAALPLAAVVACVVMSALPTLHYVECVPPRPLGRGQPPPPASI